jgi:hypothetical protein
MNNETVDSEVNKFSIAREQVNSEADLSIINGNPIVKSIAWLGRMQLDTGYQMHGGSFMKHNSFTDVTSLF